MLPRYPGLRRRRLSGEPAAVRGSWSGPQRVSGNGCGGQAVVGQAYAARLKEVARGDWTGTCRKTAAGLLPRGQDHRAHPYWCVRSVPVTRVVELGLSLQDTMLPIPSTFDNRGQVDLAGSVANHGGMQEECKQQQTLRKVLPGTELWHPRDRVTLGICTFETRCITSCYGGHHERPDWYNVKNMNHWCVNSIRQCMGRIYYAHKQRLRSCRPPRCAAVDQRQNYQTGCDSMLDITFAQASGAPAPPRCCPRSS